MDENEVVQYPDPVLEQVCSEVTDFGSGTLATAKRMAGIMKSHAGVGLAAPQIGLTERIIVVSITDEWDRKKLGRGRLTMINPVITDKSDSVWEYEEGCLSLPRSMKVKMKRPERVSVEYLNLRGDRKVHKGLPSFVSRIVQHEIDHLNGIMILSQASEDEMEQLHKQLEIRKRNAESQSV